MKSNIAALSVAIALLSACGSGDADKRLLVEAWKMKNPSLNVRQYSNTYFTSGTVLASEIGWQDAGRVSASMGCFDMIYSYKDETMESKQNLCIYLVSGPKGGGGRIWHNGDRAVLEGLMREHGFK